MSDDMQALVHIASLMFANISWAIVLADTRAGAWITDNPVSRRYILPPWSRAREAVRWVAQKARRRTNVG